MQGLVTHVPSGVPHFGHHDTGGDIMCDTLSLLRHTLSRLVRFP